MKTFNCVHPMCNKKAVTWCGYVVWIHPFSKKKQKITAGLCDEHSKLMFCKPGFEDEWVEPWKNGKPWRRRNGLIHYTMRLHPTTLVPYDLKVNKK